jgi:hypothetical protein
MSFDLTPLQTSLLSLAAVKLYLSDALRPAKALSRQDLRNSLSSYIMISVHSFNQEWKRFEGLGKEDMEIRETLRIASPLVRRIRSWKGIGRLRSSALAHEPFDFQSGKLIEVRELFGPGKAPSEFWEQILLAECAVWAISVALERHDAEREKAVMHVYADGPHDIVRCGISSSEAFDEQMDLFRKGIVEADERLSPIFQNYRTC